MRPKVSSQVVEVQVEEEVVADRVEQASKSVEEEARPEGHWHRRARSRSSQMRTKEVAEVHLLQLHHDDVGGAPAEEVAEVHVEEAVEVQAEELGEAPVEEHEHRRSP